MLRIFIDSLPALQVGAVKGNDQFVIATLGEVAGDINTLRDKHAIGFEYHLAVQSDDGKRIEAFKSQYSFGTRTDFWTGKSCLVSPLRLADPLNVVFVLADEGIRNQVVVHEIQVNIGRELGHGAVLIAGLVRLLELPVLVNWDDGAGTHCGGVSQ